MKNISSTKLRPNPLTPTLYKVDSSFERLVQSISLFGVLEPLIVFPISNEPGHFQVVSGNRRLNAVKELGLTEVPCTIIEPVELTESRVSAHQEYRMKQPSDIIRELRILEDEFGLRQGVRSNNPRIKEALDYKNQLVKDHKKSTINRLRQFDKKVRQLVQDDTDKYNRFMSDLDRSGNIAGSLKKVESLLADQENQRVAQQVSTVQGQHYTIYPTSSDKMEELSDESVATIVTSPPYFQLRVYDNGVQKCDQLGQESTVTEFVQNLARHFDDAKRVLKADGSLFINIADNVQNGKKLGVPYLFVAEMMRRGWILNDTILWSKVNPVYQANKRTVASHEYIFHFVKTVEFYYDRSWIQGQDFGPHLLTYGHPEGKVALRSNWIFDGQVLSTPVPNNHDLRVACKDRGMTLSHSATFPKQIPFVAIKSTSKPGDLVVDMFSGTATTGQVALECGRSYVGYEISPVYRKFSEIRLTELTNNSNSLSLVA